MIAIVIFCQTNAHISCVSSHVKINTTAYVHKSMIHLSAHSASPLSDPLDGSTAVVDG